MAPRLECSGRRETNHDTRHEPLRTDVRYATHCGGNCRYPRCGALLATVGCGARDPQALSAQTLAVPAPPAGAPIIVSCEPNQRTLVRPVVVNGATVSQVECITSGAVPIATQPFAAPAPDPYRQLRAVQPGAVRTRLMIFGDARVIPVSQPTTVARPIQARQVVYRDVPGAQGANREEERDHHRLVGWRRCGRRGGHRRQEGRAHRRRDRRRRGGALGSDSRGAIGSTVSTFDSRAGSAAPSGPSPSWLSKSFSPPRTPSTRRPFTAEDAGPQSRSWFSACSAFLSGETLFADPPFSRRRAGARLASAGLSSPRRRPGSGHSNRSARGIERSTRRRGFREGPPLYFHRA